MASAPPGRVRPPAELSIELESRDAYSAVALGWDHGGGLASQECYRCLTTTSKLWHNYGQLQLQMCNGCVVLVDPNVCGWCGTDDPDKGRAHSCSRCRRPVHEACETSLRGKANPHALCIVCELKLRIKHRDHASHLRLIQADLSSLLNNHIFSFLRFFEGPGPSPPGPGGRTPLQQPKAPDSVSLPEISKPEVGAERERGQQKGRGVGGGREPVPMQRARNEGVQMRTQVRDGARSSMALMRDDGAGLVVSGGDGQQERASSSLGLASGLALFERRGGGGETERGRAKKEKAAKQRQGTNLNFDEILNMTARADVNVRQQSALLNIQREFRTNWDKIPSFSVEVSGPKNQGGSPLLQEKASKASILSTMTKRHSTLHPLEQVIIVQLGDTLTEVGLCYFMRPFRDGHGGIRFLSPLEMFFRFACDFDIVPKVMSRAECRMLVYNTIENNFAEFADMFRDLSKEREEERQKHDARKKNIDEGEIGVIYSSRSDKRDTDSPETAAKQTGANHRMLGQSLLVFLQNAADFGRHRAESPMNQDDEDIDRSRSSSIGSTRVPLTISELSTQIMELDDEEKVARTLAQYPTLEQLEQKLLDEIAEAERQRIAADIARGQATPYPLDNVGVQSAQMGVWKVHLAEIFEFFVNPLHEQFSSADTADDIMFLIGKCFRTMDCDQDGIISKADAIEAFSSAGSQNQEASLLADVFLSSFPWRSDEDGVTWDEFSQELPPFDGEDWDPIGGCWRLFMEECKTVEDKIARSVQILQRDVGTIWIEPNGRKRDLDEEDMEWIDQDSVGQSAHRGLGAIFTYDSDGRTIVDKVARPGPADGKLYGGDVVIGINGRSVESKGPGQVIKLLIAAGAEKGNVELSLKRGRDIEKEVIERNPPRLPPPIHEHALHRDPLQLAEGEIGLSSVLKIMRMLGVTPNILLDSELILLCNEIQPRHVPSDGEMMLSYEEFTTLLANIVENEKFFGLVKKRVVSDVSRKAFRRLGAHEQRLGALCIVMQLPRKNVPGGVGWIKLRYYRYVALEMAHQQEAAGQTAAFADMRSNIEVRIMSQFADAKELVLGDGLSQYFEACKSFHIAPDTHITELYLSMSPLLKLENHQLKKKEACAMMGGLRGNHHVHDIVFNGLGLDDTAITDLTNILQEKGPILTKLHRLDLSNNPIGFHKALRNPPTGHGAIGDILKVLNLSRVLSELRLSGVGLGDRDARALCDLLIASKGNAMSKIDFSNNFLGDRSGRALRGVVLKCERLSYLNLTWNHFSPAGAAKILNAVEQRKQAIAEEERRRREESMLDFRTKTPGTAGTDSSNGKRTPKQVTRTFSGRTSSSRSSAFDNILAVDSQNDDPFGPRDGMYEFQRLNHKTLTQTVEYLDTLRCKTKWDDLQDEERKIDLPIVVLVDLRADGTDVHVSPKKGSKSASASAPAPIIKRVGSKGSAGFATHKHADRGSKIPLEEDMLIDQNEYLELKALLADEESENGLTLGDRLSILRIQLKGKKLRVLQVWEQMLPFQGSSHLFAATRFLHSRLGSQADVEKVEALQNVYTKPRHEIFIPADSRLSAHSAQRRRTRTPIQAYVDPFESFRESPSKKQGKQFDSDVLMATISAKLRMRSIRAKLNKGRASLPLLTKQTEEGRDRKKKTKRA